MYVKNTVNVVLGGEFVRDDWVDELAAAKLMARVPPEVVLRGIRRVLTQNGLPCPDADPRTISKTVFDWAADGFHGGLKYGSLRQL